MKRFKFLLKEALIVVAQSFLFTFVCILVIGGVLLMTGIGLEIVDIFLKPL